MDVFDTSIIEDRDGVRRGHHMGLVDTMDLAILVERDLRLGGIGVAILDDDGFNFIFRHESNLVLGHVEALNPGNIGARERISFPVSFYSGV